MPIRKHRPQYSKGLVWAALLTAAAWVPPSVAQTVATGTFLDRLEPTDVRVASYNLGGFIDDDSGFLQTTLGTAFTPPNARVIAAVDADVWAFQEIDRMSANQVAQALDFAAPLPGGEAWSAHRNAGQVIASRFPISGVVTDVPGDPREPAVATIDLPDEQTDRDLHVVNVHLKAFSGASNEARRLASVDRLLDYLEQAREPDAPRGLPEGTPIVALGDFNTASGLSPVQRLANGDFVDNARFGPDAPPDWDGTTLTVVEAQHNVLNTDTFTFRGTSRTSRLDWHVYTDSVLTLAQAFVLNTTGMSTPDLTATGLERRDVIFDSDAGRWDHLPVIADYRPRPATIPEPGTILLGVLAVGLRPRRPPALPDLGSHGPKDRNQYPQPASVA